MTKIVVSKLEADTVYVDGVRRVLVRGFTIRRPGRLAPDSARTEISDEDAEFLSKHRQFQEHTKRGFVKIVRD